MMVTMTTVGYGDGYPVTIMGKIIVVGACVVGTCLVSLMAVSLTNKTAMSGSEMKVFNTHKLLSIKERTKVDAAAFVMHIIRLNMINNRARILLLPEHAKKSELRKLDKAYGGIKTDEDLFIGKYALTNGLKRESIVFKRALIYLENNIFDPNDIIARINKYELPKLEDIVETFKKVVNMKRRCK